MKRIHGRSLAPLYLYSPSLSIQTLLVGCLWLAVHSPGVTFCKDSGQVADSSSKHATNCLFMPLVAKAVSTSQSKNMTGQFVHYNSISW